MEGQGIEKDDFIRNKRIYVGDKIRYFREKNGFSQEQLAEIMGISRATISKIENGKFAISIDYLAKFSFFLGFDFTLAENSN